MKILWSDGAIFMRGGSLVNAEDPCGCCAPVAAVLCFGDGLCELPRPVSGPVSGPVFRAEGACWRIIGPYAAYGPALEPVEWLETCDDCVGDGCDCTPYQAVIGFVCDPGFNWQFRQCYSCNTFGTEAKAILIDRSVFVSTCAVGLTDPCIRTTELVRVTTVRHDGPSSRVQRGVVRSEGWCADHDHRLDFDVDLGTGVVACGVPALSFGLFDQPPVECPFTFDGGPEGLFEIVRRSLAMTISGGCQRYTQRTEFTELLIDIDFNYDQGCSQRTSTTRLFTVRRSGCSNAPPGLCGDDDDDSGGDCFLRMVPCEPMAGDEPKSFHPDAVFTEENLRAIDPGEMILLHLGRAYRPTLVETSILPEQVEVVRGPCGDPWVRMVRCTGNADAPWVIDLHPGQFGEDGPGSAVWLIEHADGTRDCYRWTGQASAYGLGAVPATVVGEAYGCEDCTAIQPEPVRVMRVCGGDDEITVRAGLITGAAHRIDGVCREDVGEAVAIPDVVSPDRVGPAKDSCAACEALFVRLPVCNIGSRFVFAPEDEYDALLASGALDPEGVVIVGTMPSGTRVCVSNRADARGVGFVPELAWNATIQQIAALTGTDQWRASCSECVNIVEPPGPVEPPGDPQIMVGDNSAEIERFLARDPVRRCRGCGQ